MFNILRHQGNPNKKDPEIPPTVEWLILKAQGTAGLERMQGKRNIPLLLVGLLAGTTSLKINLAVPQKIEN